MRLVLPFKGLYALSQEFGVNPQNYTQYLVLYPDGSRLPLKGHNGLDFACPYRTEIIAPHNGVILEALSDPNGYGNYIKIENSIEGSVLAHLDTIDVHMGVAVKQGDHLGWSDSTGNSTGNHLHWGYYTLPRDRANGYAGFIDQTPFLTESGITVKLNELPVIANETKVLSESDKIYKGLDLTNIASVHAAIDTWYEVAQGHYVTKDSYDSLQTQYNLTQGELAQAKQDNSSLVVQDAAYAQLRAAGYQTLDDVTKALTKKEEELTGSKKQLVDVMRDNEDLHRMLGGKENQDYTVIERAFDTLKENEELKRTIAEITKAVGAERPGIIEILDRLNIFKTLAEKAMRNMQEAEQKKQEQQRQKAQEKEVEKANFWDTFMQFLSLPQ